jgi:hypothetical protein
VDRATRFLIVSHPAFPRAVRPLTPSDREVEVTLTRSSLVRVALRDATELPVENAVVLLLQLHDGRPTTSASATEAAPGEYLAAGLAPGTWTVSARAPAHEFRALDFEFPGGEQRVELREVTGGVTVRVSVPGARFFTLSSDEVGSAQLQGDVARHVTPGTWELTAYRSNHGAREVSTHTLTVTDQPTQEFTLTPAWRPLGTPP